MIVIPLISFVICFSLFSCYEHDEKKIKRLVEEWTYKEIDFPSVPIFTKFARDTIMGYYERDCDYKILTYVDSIGCMRCHLSFSAWKPFIELLIQSPNQKIPDRKTKCVIKTHINIKQNVIFGAKLKPV